MIKYLFLAFVLVCLCLFVASLLIARTYEARHPPVGQFKNVDNVRLHYVDVPAGSEVDLPPLVFIHGASGNLQDQMGAFRNRLEGRARLIFIDRPGHGYSGRGTNGANPERQAELVSGLLEQLGVEKSIFVGHSFGGAIVAGIGLNHADKAHGLIFMSAATHPWPGGISWIYTVANTPVIGPIFTYLVAVPAGVFRYESAVKGVFAPNPVSKNYFEVSATKLALRPTAFMDNAEDVDGLYDHVVRMSRRYDTIDVPTTVITGDADAIVYAHIHSKGLERDISGAKLVVLENTGHKPDYVRTDEVIAEIEALATR